MNDRKRFLEQVLATVDGAKQAVASLRTLDPELELQVEAPDFSSNHMSAQKKQPAPLSFFAMRA